MEKIFLFLPLLLLVSCKRDVSVDIPPFEEKLVAIGYIAEGDNSYIVAINKTFDPQRSQYWRYADTSFADAQVVLSIDHIPFALRRMDKSEYTKYSAAVNMSYGRLFILEKKVEKLSHLKLSVEYLGKHIESSCMLLSTPRIESAVLSGILQSSGHYKSVTVQIEADFPQGVSYYMVQVIQPGYLTTIDSLHAVSHAGSSARGYFQSNSSSRKRSFEFNNVNFTSDSNQQLFSIILSRIEKTYYDFALASQAQIRETDTFLPTETTEVPSNILGGFGIFTVMSSDTAKVRIQ